MKPLTSIVLALSLGISGCWEGKQTNPQPTKNQVKSSSTNTSIPQTIDPSLPIRWLPHLEVNSGNYRTGRKGDDNAIEEMRNLALSSKDEEAWVQITYKDTSSEWVEVGLQLGETNQKSNLSITLASAKIDLTFISDYVLQNLENIASVNVWHIHPYYTEEQAYQIALAASESISNTGYQDNFASFYAAVNSAIPSPADMREFIKQAWAFNQLYPNLDYSFSILSVHGTCTIKLTETGEQKYASNTKGDALESVKELIENGRITPLQFTPEIRSLSLEHQDVQEQKVIEIERACKARSNEFISTNFYWK